MFIEIFDYQIAKNKNFDIYQYENLNFQLLMKRLTKKRFLMQSNLQKIMYDIKKNRFVFNDDENLQKYYLNFSINKFIAGQFICDNKFRFQLMKFLLSIMRVNSFIEINDRNFNKTSFSTIKKNFKEIVETILKNKDDANFSAHKLLFYKKTIKLSSI